VSLRGYHGGDVDNLFLDGMRLMSDGGSHNVLQIDPWFIERVDVIRGPSSALYGQSVPGGVVNMTSKRPQFAPEGHFRLSGGTQNTKGRLRLYRCPQRSMGLPGYRYDAHQRHSIR
jgi:iron complex outermembrane receptor protein